MNSLRDRPLDRTLVLVGLLVLKETLAISKYPKEIQEEMSERIDHLIKELNEPLPVVDAYGNPYE